MRHFYLGKVYKVAKANPEIRSQAMVTARNMGCFATAGSFAVSRVIPVLLQILPEFSLLCYCHILLSDASHATLYV